MSLYCIGGEVVVVRSPAQCISDIVDTLAVFEIKVKVCNQLYPALVSCESVAFVLKCDSTELSVCATNLENR